MHRLVLLLTAAAVIFAEGGPAAPSAPAPGPGGAPAGNGGLGALFPFLLIGGMILMMWFMVIRPQKKEEKRRKEMIDGTKRGDEVVTIGGVHGTVEAVGETTIDVRVGKGADTIIATFNKGAVSANLTAERANAKN
jgi:preprotein translocase subunit YajC